MARLLHLSENLLEQLRDDIPDNLDRYLGDGFADLKPEPGWAIELEADVDLEVLEELDGPDNRSETDLKNSRVVLRALGNLSPTLANEERIWARLSHIEAFTYSRDRWLKRTDDSEKATKLTGIHFFARTQTGIRDDHAISRLWWNGFIARHCYPDNPDRALELLHTSADVRSNMVERIWLSGRRKLASGVFRIMDSDPRVLATETSFRGFMKALNMLGGGVVFEAMTDAETDDFMKRCADAIPA
ncbi:DUF6339 family protein [Aliiroseovarius crassostreae]|uniref:DUF6339 family protein n=1 Tax=Aliiroseovarius crassostreae TaxID=154981 RepID=UPI003C7B09F0